MWAWFGNLGFAEWYSLTPRLLSHLPLVSAWLVEGVAQVGSPSEGDGAAGPARKRLRLARKHKVSTGEVQSQEGVNERQNTVPRETEWRSRDHSPHPPRCP